MNCLGTAHAIRCGMASVEIPWTKSSSGITPTNDEAHVWCVNLDLPPSATSELFKILTPDEQQRADQYKFERGRTRFITARSMLRRLLGNALQQDPSALTFRYTERGKPELTVAGEGQLRFNVSHSDALALIALTRSHAVGVDLERIRPVTYVREIADRFFTDRESAALALLPEAEQTTAFFNLWTRKEAWLKATGDGIAEALKRVEVSFLPAEPACILDIAGSPKGATEWTLMDLKPAEGFTGALAVQAKDLNVLCRQWVE